MTVGEVFMFLESGLWSGVFFVIGLKKKLLELVLKIELDRLS